MLAAPSTGPSTGGPTSHHLQAACPTHSQVPLLAARPLHIPNEALTWLNIYWRMKTLEIAMVTAIGNIYIYTIYVLLLHSIFWSVDLRSHIFISNRYRGPNPTEFVQKISPNISHSQGRKSTTTVQPNTVNSKRGTWNICKWGNA